ncbi:helix-turn-helix domain-containing protein [Hydrocarboniphaga sp.]|uniref:helix-turn-helix domain-containing protein n=1 Tax=Hydrocarboniphaga sp. TaxID=2033016 RepID=UPI002630EE24|nr:helix-turn-helix domain-containing protein [Hydrocarboniphaga sp.]
MAAPADSIVVRRRSLVRNIVADQPPVRFRTAVWRAGARGCENPGRVGTLRKPCLYPAARRRSRQERAAVLSAMAGAQGNLGAAARTLGVSRAALHRRLEKHGL